MKSPRTTIAGITAAACLGALLWLGNDMDAVLKGILTTALVGSLGALGVLARDERRDPVPRTDQHEMDP